MDLYFPLKKKKTKNSTFENIFSIFEFGSPKILLPPYKVFAYCRESILNYYKMC